MMIRLLPLASNLLKFPPVDCVYDPSHPGEIIMIRSVFLLIVSLAMAQSVFPQDESSWERRTQLALELGYFSPGKETFRNNYDQRLVFGSASIPVSVGLEIDEPFFSDLDLTLNVRRINHKLKS